MIINLLLIIPVIGSIIIGIIPVSELSEKEAENLLMNSHARACEACALDHSAMGETNKANKEEIEKILKKENTQRTRNLQIIGLTFAILNFIISIYM